MTRLLPSHSRMSTNPAIALTADESNSAVTIGIINNMSDGAFKLAEQQFCGLLTAATEKSNVRIRLYSPPSVPRSTAIAQHITSYYDDFFALSSHALDGLIVTGAEPTGVSLVDEPCYDDTARLFDWAESHAVPSIWSCLASHIVVHHAAGINRIRLPQKLSGLFNCSVEQFLHPRFSVLPPIWKTPHSRHHGLCESDLSAREYTILSLSSDAGVDVFYKDQAAPQVFFQGHPEYSTSTLMGEFRRDVKRYLRGFASVYPNLPVGCVPPEAGQSFVRLRTHNPAYDQAGHLEELDKLIAHYTIGDDWTEPARQIYQRWLDCVRDARTRKRRPNKRTYSRVTEWVAGPHDGS